jgi:protein subunit release factor B
MKEKMLLFSITKKDFTVETFRSGGKGGQNQNKVESGVRIKHPASGAVAECREQRNQLQNKHTAFQRLVKTAKFQAWHKIKVASIMQGIANIDKDVDKAMEEKNLKVEYYTPK